MLVILVGFRYSAFSLLSCRSPVRDSLVYDESAKKVEFEAEGRVHKFSVYEALELVDRRDWEASLPVKIEKKEEKAEDRGGRGAGEEEPRTPAAQTTAQRINHKKKKTPKSKPPADKAKDKAAKVQ